MEKAIIRTLNPQSRIYFNGTVTYSPAPKDASAWHKLYSGQTIQITQEYECYQAKEARENKPAWALRMDENRTSFFIEWDKDSNTTFEQNKAIAVKHLMYHERVQPLFAQVNTNKRGEPFFTIEYEGMKNTFIADLNDKKSKVFLKFREMHPSEKRDCAYYYGVNATNMKHSELIAKLADFEKGILMQNLVSVDGINILDHFLMKYGNYDVTAIKLLCEKAITYGIISKRDNGFYLDNDYIGTTQEVVYDYVKSNPQVEKMLKTQTQNNDKTVEDDMIDEPQAKPIIQKEPVNMDELDLLRKRADDLGVKYAKNMKDIPRLKSEIKGKERGLELRDLLFKLTGKDPGNRQTSFLELEYKNALKNQKEEVVA